MAMHEDQLFVGEDAVRQLIREQFPQWAELGVRPVPTAATVNAIFRVGDDLAARFPYRPEDGSPDQLAADLAALLSALRAADTGGRRFEGAGDGPGLVLRQEQPGRGPMGASDPPAARRRAWLTARDGRGEDGAR